MSTKRRPAEPPMIDGYEFKRLLGQGGFADVFVYQQRTPHREVAVKVLLREMLGTDAVTRLNAEADAMAGLSQHPNIVTIFGAGVAADGRPYIVMDYYRRPSLAEELKGPRRSVASGLAIGVQLAGALESAHRLNIVHRDIKPANILVDSVGRPVLGDFGIALNVADPSKSAEGMSVPWSPPEAFAAEPWADRQSDVWALAATIYTLLAGRAPFVEPNGDNRIHAHADRIQHAPLRPLGRADVPASLDQVLGTAMAKEPRARYQTALQLGQQLRAVQQELQLAPTPLEVTDYSVADGHPKDDDDEAAQGTRLRPITVIDAYGGAFGAAPGAGTGPAAGSGVPPNPATGTNVPPNPATAPGVPPNLATGTGWASAAPGTGGGGAADPAGAAGAGTATNWDGGAGPTGLSGTWTAQWSWPAPAGRGLTTAPGASVTAAPPAGAGLGAGGTASSQGSAATWSGAGAFPAEATLARGGSLELPGQLAEQLPGQLAGQLPGQLAGEVAGQLPGQLAGQLPVDGGPAPAGGRPGRARRVWTGVVVGVALAAGIGAGLWWLAERAGEQDTPSLGGLGEAGNSTEVSPQDPLSGAAPAAPADLVGVVTDGQAVFTWSNPSAADGDSYRWRRISELGDAASEMTLATLPTVSLPIEGDEPVCIEVVTVRANGTGSVGSAKGCAK